MEIINIVKTTITKYAMLSDNDHVLIGLSGGPDSVSLAVILDKLKNDFNLSLSAIYIDHGLRPGETGREIDFCRKVCNSLSMGIIIRDVDANKYAKDKKMNIHEAARELRYGIFDEVALQLNALKIALGHNADDQAETVLMRIFRGSGRKGLAGIPPVRGKIIRPLIDVERNSIVEFLLSEKTTNILPSHEQKPYIIDSSNFNENYMRNWLRHNIMMSIKEKNPSVVQDICRTADIMRDEENYLELIVTKKLMKLISRKSSDSIELFLLPLETIEITILRRVLRRAVNETFGLRGIHFVHIEDIISLIKKGRSGDSIDLPGRIRVIKDYALLKITGEKQESISEYEIKPPGKIIIEETDIVLKSAFEEKTADESPDRNSVILDAGSMKFPLKVRHRTLGDFFYPLGFGKKKKLQDFFVDEKVPRDKRDSIPIVLSGNDIIWVAGYRADERFRVTDKTDTFLRLTIKKL